MEEDSVLSYYDHWLSVIMYFFKIHDPESIDENKWLDLVQRWLHLEKLNFLPVKLKT